MIVCDRCGNKIPKVTDKTKRTLTIYQRAAAYIHRQVDICEDCSRVIEDVIQKAQSYIMVNKENPSEIFDSVKYWTD